jgi:hypothetical protein
LSHNVTLIYNRTALHVAFDLVAHSVLGFTFKGEKLSRGWVECLVVGDTRVGKSKVAKELVKHYGLGRVADCERVSLAGLVGGMQQINKSWNINWGLIPLYDRQLLVLDEAQGLTVDQIGEMSGLRSNGVAELIKIQQERTPARCRLYWIANRRKAVDNRIDDLSYGVRAVTEVMGRMEDIARLDFALVVSETDVPESVMNAKERTHVAHKFTSELCHNLILWAWSRRPEDIVFVDDCEDFILDAATRLSQTYSSEVPIVERSEQRIRLARLSCAMAARLFSTDETATKLLVRKEHVVLVEEYLHSIYKSKAMRYDRFSAVRKSQNTFTPEQLASCIDRIQRFNKESLTALAAYLNESEEVDKMGLAEATGWELDTARQFIQMFTTRLRGLRPSQNRKLIKTPLMVAALKQIEQQEGL